MYEYRATVVKVVDADTIDVDTDLGFGIKFRQRLRFFGINAWETRGPERTKGLVAKAFVQEKIGDKIITIRTEKDKTGKYGRYLATIFYSSEDPPVVHIDLNRELVQLGHARTQFY